jgi:hypothetical protein
MASCVQCPDCLRVTDDVRQVTVRGQATSEYVCHYRQDHESGTEAIWYDPQPREGPS